MLFTPRMAILEHIHTCVDNMAAQGWANRGIIITASSVGPILQEISLAERLKHIQISVGRALLEDNKMADAALHLTHLPDRKFLSHFCTHFSQINPWHLPSLPSTYRRKLTTIIHNKI